MFDLISTAHAQSGASGTQAAIGNIIFMVLLFAIFYFLLIRPQQKQQKVHKEMLQNLQRGDSIMTGGGLLGKVHRVEDDTVMVELGEVEVGDKSFRPLRVKVRRSTISLVTAKAGTQPVSDSKEEKSEDKPK
ncbi:MAG: preprotein translocase subunit YajC [Magnetococcales bacterium]|nr:preprotein translocase subunit YajC [Magnetococcales bacterium]MBF0149332.1 preprotein translocase subunit YajC [Magnetococcales bacterium]MBF0173359.1 preprotein translocase subunit YajC [Magnetococcales bacterium]MBF0348838.1 preprotein translocase subunit YajC [Magnetococcales bacterium]MBF0632048.1 preprotein translocase subunit YajC [Magnetococcales bacterium]